MSAPQLRGENVQASHMASARKFEGCGRINCRSCFDGNCVGDEIRQILLQKSGLRHGPRGKVPPERLSGRLWPVCGRQSGPVFKGDNE